MVPHIKLQEALPKPPKQPFAKYLSVLQYERPFFQN